MRAQIALVFAAFLGFAPAMQAADLSITGTAVERWRANPAIEFDAGEVALEDFLWTARPVVVFADSPENPALKRQLDLLRAGPDDLAERDVAIIVDNDPGAMSELRRTLRPRGFMLVLIGKDGGVKLRKPAPWTVREITRSIDKMPIRRQEIRDRPASAE